MSLGMVAFRMQFILSDYIPLQAFSGTISYVKEAIILCPPHPPKSYSYINNCYSAQHMNNSTSLLNYNCSGHKSHVPLEAPPCLTNGLPSRSNCFYNPVFVQCLEYLIPADLHEEYQALVQTVGK
nr:crustacean hyperglycemic hormones 3-like [Penaeus vannamei]